MSNIFCPKCGQQQLSVEARFCSRCGFPTDEVKQLVAADGVLPTIEKESQRPRRSPRREGVRQGVLLMCVFLLMLPFTESASGHRWEILPQIFMMAGFVRVLYAVFFQEGAPRRKRRDGSQADSDAAIKDKLRKARGTALPPARSIPVTEWRQQANTAEIISPPSVTENTTKLLDKDA
jgi:hypothetical protein